MDVLAAAFTAIDEANATDPTTHDGKPLAQVQGQLADGWVLTLDSGASDALRLAARAHHLRRWVVPRSTYPEGRPGYLRWRRDQKTRHAEELGELLGAVGVDPTTIGRAREIVAKIRARQGPGGAVLRGCRVPDVPRNATRVAGANDWNAST